MITSMPDEKTLAQWKAVWRQYKNQLRPNRKTGQELVEYLQAHYPLTEIEDSAAAQAVYDNVVMNAPFAEKIPAGEKPVPRTFFLENAGAGARFYRDENRDPFELWGAAIERIFVGIDVTTGFYMVEGSTLLWDELDAVRGLDAADLENFVCVAQYIASLQRMNWLDKVLGHGI